MPKRNNTFTRFTGEMMKNHITIVVEDGVVTHIFSKLPTEEVKATVIYGEDMEDGIDDENLHISSLEDTLATLRNNNYIVDRG